MVRDDPPEWTEHFKPSPFADQFPYNVPTDLSAEAGESIERIIEQGPPQWVKDELADGKEG